MFRSFATNLGLAVMLAVAAGAPAAARSHATPTPAPTATPPPEDTAVTAVARREFVAWQANIVDKTRYSAAMQATMTDAQVSQTSRNLSTVGALQRTVWLGPYGPADASGAKSYLFHMICTNDAVYELLTLSPDGKIAGIAFRDTLK